MRKNNAFRRAAALMAALSITVSLAAPAFAGTGTYYIDDGDITVTKNANGTQTVLQNGTSTDESGEVIITTKVSAIGTLESDLEGPAAEDSGFGPVVEDNYQPAQPEDAEEPKDANQPEGAAQPESTEEPEAAAPAAAPGFLEKTITVINNAVDKVLNLTLKDVKIDVSNTGSMTAGAGKAALSVQGDGNVEIELDGDNELKSGFHRAGLEKTSTGTLTLKDDNQKVGSLTATGGAGGGAGIGGGKDSAGKNITITGGTVNAAGGDGGAGIGGGGGGSATGSGENITITGGTVTATGGLFSAGIGGGHAGDGKNIKITGGTVTAAGGDNGAGIGGSNGGDGKNITITGGTVDVTGGKYGAGIGGGHTGNGKNITITGGTVNTVGGAGGAGIGGGLNGNGEDITINGGTVTATGGYTAAGIGGGVTGDGRNITITDGTVTATGGIQGAGIGGGAAMGNGENITITGGTVTATGGDTGAGIGGGSEGSGSNVTVSGAAQVHTTGGKSGLFGTGASIGHGGKKTPGGELVDGDEIQADIDNLLPDYNLLLGYIHHVNYNQDGTVKREWWERKWFELEPSHPTPQPTPNAPAEEDYGFNVDTLKGTPQPTLDLHVETLEGAPLPFNARQQGSTLRVTTDHLSARLHGTRHALETLQEHGVEQIQFVTTFKTTTLSVAELLAEGGSWFALEHNGLVSRQLSAAQAESLKCQMR